MLCEQCHQQEATVHLTVLLWPASEPAERNFCQACYPDAEAARIKAYNSQPPSPLPDSVEDITAAEFLAAGDKAARNAVDRPAFDYILDQLTRLPETRERLVFDLLQLAWQTLKRGEDPPLPPLMLAFCYTPREPARLAEYIAWLKRIILRCVELRRQLPASPGEHGPFSLEISWGLIALRRVSPTRFAALLRRLKKQGADPALDPRWKVIATVEQRRRRAKRRTP